jgi:hypothetical protein
MALPKRNAATRSNKAAVNSDSWKAKGIINIYVTGASRTKLGILPLRESNAIESKLLEWIGDDAGDKAASLMDKFELTYNSVSVDDALDFIELDSDDESIDDKGVLGYLNFALPSSAGSSRIGAIVLKDGESNHRKIASWLLQDEGNIEVLKSKMSIIYHTTEKSTTSDVKLFI